MFTRSSAGWSLVCLACLVNSDKILIAIEKTSAVGIAELASLNEE